MCLCLPQYGLMPRTPGCWANVLNDCIGQLEHEHCISVAAVQHEDPYASRKQKEKVVVRHGLYRTSTSRTYDIRISKLSAKILCHGHNIGTSNLDTASGFLCDAIAAHCDVRRIHPLTQF